MPKTIQIRDIDDDVYAELGKRAAEAGISIPELLRKEATRIASRPSMTEWLQRTRRRPSEVTPSEVVAALDEMRGQWPDDAGR
jgi:antitoxin FitA